MAPSDRTKSATFVHELGHTPGLHHGGPANAVNYKPNYVSVMNYYYSLIGIPDWTASATRRPRWATAQTQPVGLDYPVTFGYNTGMPGFSDWPALKWRMGIGPDKAGGAPSPTGDEPTEAQANALRPQLLDALVRATGADVGVSVTGRQSDDPGARVLRLSVRVGAGAD